MTTTQKLTALKQQLEEERARANDLHEDLRSRNICTPNGYDPSYAALMKTGRRIQRLNAEIRELEQGSEQ